MTGLTRKSLDSPEEVRKFHGGSGQLNLVNLDAGPVGRATFEPGWRWSEHVKPIAKTDSCQAAHMCRPRCPGNRRVDLLVPSSTNSSGSWRAVALSALTKKEQQRNGMSHLDGPDPSGKLEAWQQFHDQMSGARRSEHDASRQRMGMLREVASLMRTPQGDFVCLYHESEDLAKTFRLLVESEEPYDVWFRQNIQEIHGITPETMTGAPAELKFNWPY